MNRYKHKFVLKTVKHSASVMVWGCFSGKKGHGGLPSMKKHKATFFLQDGAPCHTSKLVKNYLNESRDRFSIMDWQRNSPDLNAIENCWSYMKRRLKGNINITSLPKLQDAIKRMWELDMGLSYFRKLSDSMPKRLQLVIDQKGEMTKY
jgi:hypothetical protein